MAIRILAFAGSKRSGSWNDALVGAVAERLHAAGAEVTHVSLADYPMPLYDADGEARDGVPDGATRLAELVRTHEGVVIGCPEYNSSITPLLKNTIDWVTRAPGEGGHAWLGKVAGLVAASPGALGGIRGLVHVRSILGNLGVHVVPTQVALPKAHEAFGADGSLVDAGAAERVEAFCGEVARTVAGLG